MTALEMVGLVLVFVGLALVVDAALATRGEE